MRKFLVVLLVLTLLVVAIWTVNGIIYFNDRGVVGQVVDADSGEPVTGARLRIGVLEAFSGDNGVFSLTGLQGKGPERLVVEADGYYPQVQPVEWAWWQRDVATDLQLRPTHLVGVVLDAWTAQPVAGAFVASDARTAIADDAGRFTLTGLVPPAQLAASAPGYLSQSAVVTGYQAFDTGTELRLELTPNAVAGAVRAADTGEPVPGAVVSLGDQTATTDALGRFQIHRVVPGASVQVVPADIFTPVQVSYAGDGDLLIAVEPRRLTVTARDGLMGTPLPGTLVVAAGISRTVETIGAQFNRIALGTRLQLVREGYLTTEVTYRGEAHLDVTLRPFALQGVVRDSSTGQPLPGALLYVGSQVVAADGSGFYRIAELPDDMQITLKSAGFRKATLSLRAGTVALPSLDVKAANCAQPPPTPGPLCLDLGLTPFQARGLYIPFGLLSRPDDVRALLDLIDRTELNALVVDVKSDAGQLAYASQVPLAVQLGIGKDRKGWLTLKDLLAEAKARNIYTVARMVVFKDNPLAWGVPDLAAKRADGSIWIDGEGLGWANPFREEVWDYNIALAKEVAALGFDEIQFDYLRFPSDGDVGAIVYAEENTLPTRTAAIREFVRRMAKALRPYGIFTSADVFGLTVWVEPDSDMGIGQRVADVAPLVDYLCPMVYPATFRPSNLGYTNPSAHPYDVIYRSQQAAVGRVPATTRVRPWLQAYWYSLDEMLLQKQAADDAGSTGWTFWNAGGVYDPSLFADGP
jgi:hypothetical protein